MTVHRARYGSNGKDAPSLLPKEDKSKVKDKKPKANGYAESLEKLKTMADTKVVISK